MVIRKIKFFLDFEKEEAWLNEMSQKGLHLVGYKWGRYDFEQGTPGEYIYRIEMLESFPSNRDEDYLEFMKEMEIELVATFNSWAFFRKKAAEGPFEIFTDTPSRIKHYETITKSFGIVFLVNLLIALFNISTFIEFNRYLSIVNIAVAILLMIAYIRFKLKIKGLREEN